MLTRESPFALSAPMAHSALLVAAIVTGGLLGSFTPGIGQVLSDYLDYTLLTLITLLFFGVRFSALAQALTDLRFFLPSRWWRTSC